MGPAPNDQPLSARATVVLSEASVFFAFCCCLLCFFVFCATAGFCRGCSVVSTLSSQAKAAFADRAANAAATAVASLRMMPSFQPEWPAARSIARDRGLRNSIAGPTQNGPAPAGPDSTSALGRQVEDPRQTEARMHQAPWEDHQFGHRLEPQLP